MPNFSCKIRGAVVKAAVRDDSGSQSRPHSQEHHILASSTRAKTVFGYGPCIGVILKPAADMKFLFKDRFDGNIHPRGEIWGRLNNADDSIQRATAAHANPMQDALVLTLFGEQFSYPRFDELKGAVGSLVR